MSRDGAAPDALRLERGDAGLVLHGGPAGGKRGFLVDLTDFDVRTGPGNLSRKQPLARAVGTTHETIIDATAGFGHDAALLALMGYRVAMIERHETVAALLADALERAVAHPDVGVRLGGRLTLHVGDAAALLATLEPPDVVYLDPMYPPKAKAALPPKAAQVLRVLVGDDDDAADLLEAARGVARRRVVVKRPVHAPPLGGAPSHAVKSKLARWDVYVTA